ncbi:uncharacterized protein LOC117665559 [Pantherophis guttatus]|uniref:Uncharacterized protein LOC117665559 n=1 Tax=Pantherophis guttatus TaxID=94885 RepID=A0ABM3Z567_PANGU|nr:uncharacterized protein LOC117665559 [Pantherophis guttatus]XP_060543516.1 uncharacterized protein LOC117665559 [Pantherophis guttatus]
MHWILRYLVSGAQVIGGSQSHLEPKRTQPIRSVSQVQDAVSSFDSDGCQTQRLSTICGPARGLLTCPNTSGPPSLPEVCLQQPPLSIPRDAFRVIISTQDLHQTGGGSGSGGQDSRNPLNVLPRRYHRHVAFPGSSKEGHGVGVGDIPGPRFFHQPSKEPYVPNDPSPTFRSDNRFTTGPGLFVPDSYSGPQSDGQTGTGPEESTSTPLITTAREDGVLHIHRAVGSQACPPPAVATTSLPETGPQHLQFSDCLASSGSPISSVVEVSRTSEGVSVSRTQPTGPDIRRKSSGLGCSLTGRGGARSVVSGGAGEQHQLAGIEGCSSRITPLPSRPRGTTCAGPNGQHHHQGTHKSGGGHTLQGLDGGVRETVSLGGAPHSISGGRPHFGTVQRDGRLAQQGAHRPCGVEPEPYRLRAADTQVRPTSGRHVCNSPERPTTPLLLTLSKRTIRGQRRATLPVAHRTSLCLSPNSFNPSLNSETDPRRCRAVADSPAVASETLVCGSTGTLHRPALDVAGPDGLAKPGGRRPPRSAVAPINRLAFERLQLQKDRLSVGVISVIQSARRPSTTRIYEASWRAFTTWCLGHHVDPTAPDIPDVLDFLHDGLSKGLAPATLRRQVAALSTVIVCERHRTL